MNMVTLNGVDIHYEVHGGGFPFVLAHGYCASLQMWRHQVPLLAQRYRIKLMGAGGLSGKK